MAKINSSHIAIPTILKVEDGALSKIGPYLRENNLQKVVIYFGNGVLKNDEYIIKDFDSFVGTLKRNVSRTLGPGPIKWMEVLKSYGRL